MSSAIAQRRQSPSEKEKMRGKRSFSSSLPGSALFGASSRSKEKDGRGKVADPIVQLGDSSQHTIDFPSTTPPRSTSPIPERLYPRRSVRHSLPSVSVTMSDSALVSPPLSTGSTTSRRSTPSQLKSSLMSHLNRHSIAVPPVGFPSVEGLPFPAELKKQKSASSITFIPDDENKLTTRPRKLSQQSYSSSNSSSSQKGMWIPHFRKGEATVSGISAVGEGSSVLWRTVSEPAKPAQDVTANQLLTSLSEGPIAGVELTKTLSTLAESPSMELDEPIAGQLDRHPLVNGADYDSDLASSPQPLSPLQRPTSPPPIIPPTPPRASSPPRTILKDSSSPVRPRPQSRRSVSFSLPAAIVIKPTVVASVEVELDDDDRKVRGSDIDTESEEGKTPTGMHFADADGRR
ncbi:hypothetical protein BT69DRAFT_523036 [Atractiella rhizophila]|nr:hypothetical protein BT69DRAFT_523036 [Atractiella rhizophila]